MKNKYFISLLVLMVVSSYCYAQNNISWLYGWVGIKSVDGNKVKLYEEVAQITPGEHTIEGKSGAFTTAGTFMFESDKYYILNRNQDTIRFKELFINDCTDLVLCGHGAEYDIFSNAEKKAGINKLSDGIGKIRAPKDKSDYNFGVHNYSPNISNYATIRIKASDGLLVIKNYNSDNVNWYGNEKGGVVVIPSGKQTLILDYLAPRSGRPDVTFYTNNNSVYNIINNSNNSVSLALIGFEAFLNTVTKGKTNERDTSNIYVNYEFFPGAEYEISFVKSKTKGAPYAEVEIIPKKGAPKGQPRGRGTVLSYEDIIAANSVAEAKKVQIRYSVAINGKQEGPYSYDELRQFVTKGELTKDSLVWKEGMQQWTAAGTVNELADIWTSVPPPLPPPLP